MSTMVGSAKDPASAELEVNSADREEKRRVCCIADRHGCWMDVMDGMYFVVNSYSTHMGNGMDGMVDGLIASSYADNTFQF